jgi:peptidoglycan/LPS O-acetylase OafA/YrhL
MEARLPCPDDAELPEWGQRTKWVYQTALLGVGYKPFLVCGSLMYKPDNFNLLRLMAASGVMIFHVGVIVGRPSNMLPSQWTSLGSLAVHVFFVISGYLLTLSLISNSDPTTYLRNRALRILPALIGCSFATVFLLGAALTSSHLFFLDPATWRYLLGCSAIFACSYVLPGVFSDAVTPVVNGSLWTLPYEAICYIGLLLIFRSCGKYRSAALATVGIACAIAAFNGYEFRLAPSIESPHVFDLTAFFVCGAILANFRIQGSLWLDVAAMFTAILGVYFSQEVWQPFWIAMALWLPYAVIRIAHLSRQPFHEFLKRNDVSYGFFLYSFPVTQAVSSIVGRENILVVVTVSLVVTLLCAAGSWKLIEQPILKFRRHAKAILPLGPLMPPSAAVTPSAHLS